MTEVIIMMACIVLANHLRYHKLNMRLFFIFMVFIYISILAHGKVPKDACRDVDLAERFGKIRDQGTASACFAFAIADLIGFNQGFPKDVQVSALDVQLNIIVTDPKKVQYELSKIGDWHTFIWATTSALPKMKEHQEANVGKTLWQRITNGGAASVSLLSYNASGGVCTEKQLPSEGSKNFRNDPNYIYNKVGRGISQAMGVGKSEKFQYSTLLCEKTDPFRRLLSESEVIEDEAALNLANELRKKCEPRLPIKPINPSVFPITRGSTSPSSKILAALIGKGIPMGIGYDASFLTKLNSPNGPENHASVIVGSHWNRLSKSCEFKIRNSWGIRCEFYQPNIRSRCESGYLWVSDKEIDERTSTIFGIDPQTK